MKRLKKKTLQKLFLFSFIFNILIYLGTLYFVENQFYKEQNRENNAWKAQLKLDNQIINFFSSDDSKDENSTEQTDAHLKL